MQKVCQVTGKGSMSGNNVSHSQRKTKRRFMANLHDHRFYLPSENRFVKLVVSKKGLKTIDKFGIEYVIAKLKKEGKKV